MLWFCLIVNFIKNIGLFVLKIFYFFCEILFCSVNNQQFFIFFLSAASSTRHYNFFTEFNMRNPIEFIRVYAMVPFDWFFFRYFLFSCLVFLFLLLFSLFFVVDDVLVLFVVGDLCLTFLAVLFIFASSFLNIFVGFFFFFVILTVAACETALALGFLVSFSRRHKSNVLTFKTLKYLSN